MAIGTRAELHSAIDDYTDRSYSEARKDIFVANAEAKFNRRLTPTFRRITNTTLTTDSSGEATLPSGFVGLRSIVRDVVGSAPLKQVSWDALIALNPYEIADDPTHYAVKGTTLKVAPVCEDDFITEYDSTLTALTSTNSTNWLLTLAPDAYLTMCLAEEALFIRDFAGAGGLEQTAYNMIDAVVSMDLVAALGNAELQLDFVTP